MHGSDDDITTSEPSEPRFGWTNHPLAGPILVLSTAAVGVIVARFLMRNTLNADFDGPCGRDVACSVSNAP